jgi:hypothetical protein
LNSGKNSSIVYQHGRLEEIKEEKNKREIKRYFGIQNIW